MPNYDRLLIFGILTFMSAVQPIYGQETFFNLIESFNPVQYVNGPTHIHGHILDLVFSYGLTVCDLEIIDIGFSDHKSVVFNITFLCP